MAIFLLMLGFASLLAGGECLSGSDPSNVEVTGADRLELMKTRVSVLELGNEELKEQLKQVISELTETKSELTQTRSELTGVSTRVHSLEDRTHQQIGFHASGLKSTSPSHGSPLIVNTVRYNVGKAYFGRLGYFNATVPGLYFFTATTGTSSFDHYIGYSLMVNNIRLSWAYAHADSGSHNELATVHGVMHLTAGQKVWLRGTGDTYDSGTTTFIGALLSPDP